MILFERERERKKERERRTETEKDRKLGRVAEGERENLKQVPH